MKNLNKVQQVRLRRLRAKYGSLTANECLEQAIHFEEASRRQVSMGGHVLMQERQAEFEELAELTELCNQ